MINKFTDGNTLRARITPPALVTEKDHVVDRRVYTESLNKKQNRIKSMSDYKKDLLFQSLFSHVKFYIRVTGLKTLDILMNDDH